CSAADDGEVHAPKILKGGERIGAQAPFANHDAHAVLLEQRPREALHAIARRGADADWRVARRVLRTLFHLTYVRGGMNHGMPGEIEARLAPAVEHVDLRGVADAEQRALQGDRVVHAQLSDLGFANRRVEVVMHYVPRSDF